MPTKFPAIFQLDKGIRERRGCANFFFAWFSNEEGSIGTATLVAANDKLYGFWYRPEDKMVSPWNADKQSGIDGADMGKCRAVLYPPV